MMSSITRSIKRGIMFKDMNKQQKQLWRDSHKGHKRGHAKTRRNERRTG